MCRSDAVADPVATPRRGDLRVPHPREPGCTAADGVAALGLFEEGGIGGGAAGRRLDALQAGGDHQSGRVVHRQRSDARTDACSESRQRRPAVADGAQRNIGKIKPRPEGRRRLS